MKKLLVSLVGAVLVLAMVSAVVAEEGKAGKRTKLGKKARKHIAAKRCRPSHGKAFQELGLSEDQVKAIVQAMKDAHKQAADIDDPAERRKAMREALEKAVKDNVDDAELQAKILNAAMRVGRAGRGGKPPIQDWGLTDEQKQELGKIRKNGMKQIAKAEGKEAKIDAYKAMQKSLDEYMEENLTKENLAKYHAWKKNRFQRGKKPDLGLSDGQQQAFRKILQDGKAKYQKAEGEEAKAKIKQETKDAIDAFMEENLSEENLKKYREMKKNRRGGPGIKGDRHKRHNAKKIRAHKADKAGKAE